MKVTQDEIVDRQAVLNIEVDAESLEEHLDRAFKRLVRRVDVPGFRRGKAPRTLFERAYGRDRLVEQALETMVPSVVAKAIEDSDLETSGSPSVSVLERDPEPRIKATVPLTPAVTLGDYESVRFDDRPEEVTAEQVDGMIERMREAQATWDPVDRTVEVGDMAVLASVEGTAAGKQIFSAKDIEYVVAADAAYPVPGFATELVGLSAGGSKHFDLILPDDFPDKEVAGETATFTVSVADVKKKIVPPLDDELAKGVGEGFETLDELRAGVRTDLETQAQTFHKRQLEEKALDAIVESSTIEVAPLTIEHETEHVIAEQQQALARYRISVQDYMSGVGKSSDEILGEARQTALSRLEKALVIEKLAEVEGVDVTEERIGEEVEQLRQSASSPAERDSYQGDSARESVRTVLRRRMTLDRIVEIVSAGAPVVSGDNVGEPKAAVRDGV